MYNLVGEHEAARILSLKVEYLQQMRWLGTGPIFIKLGSAVRYDLGDLEAYIAAGCRSPTPSSRRLARSLSLPKIVSILDEDVN